MFKFKTYVILSYQGLMHIFVLEIIKVIIWFLDTKNKNFNYYVLHDVIVIIKNDLQREHHVNTKDS